MSLNLMMNSYILHNFRAENAIKDENDLLNDNYTLSVVSNTVIVGYQCILMYNIMVIMAHTEPCLKCLYQRCLLCLFGTLTSYYNCIKPVLSNTYNRYEMRKPLCRLPLIKHTLAEQSLHCSRMKQLNRENGRILTTSTVHTHYFYGLKINIKSHIIQPYNDYCAIIN